MDDNISRQVAIDAINNHFGFNIEEEYGSAVQEVINGLPPAERKRGKWIKIGTCKYRCDQCGKIVFADDSNELNYCSHCGAKMLGGGDEG